MIRYEGVMSSFLGETAARLDNAFEFARTRRCVLFFDELDTIAKERADEHETGEIKRVVSTLLLQIDRLPPHVILVGATNHGELLDRAAWRRFQIRRSWERLAAHRRRDSSNVSLSASEATSVSLLGPSLTSWPARASPSWKSSHLMCAAVRYWNFRMTTSAGSCKNGLNTAEVRRQGDS